MVIKIMEMIMKTLIAAVALATLVASPTFAQSWDSRRRFQATIVAAAL